MRLSRVYHGAEVFHTVKMGIDVSEMIHKYKCLGPETAEDEMTSDK